MKSIKILMIAAFASLAFAFTIDTPDFDMWDNWRELGRVKAGHNGDHDRIEIIGKHDTFRRIKIRVENSPLKLKKMVVLYDGDGAPENIDIKDELPKGGESRAIDLKGGKRKLKSVEFWFETKGFLNGKAEVILYGDK